MQDRHHLVPLWRPTLWHEVRILDLRRQPGTLLSPLTHRHTLNTHRKHQDYYRSLKLFRMSYTRFYSRKPEAEGERGRGSAKCGCPKCGRCNRHAVRQRRGSYFTVTIFGKSAVKFIYHMHDDTNTTKSSEISDYLSMQIFWILRICTSQFALSSFEVKILIFLQSVIVIYFNKFYIYKEFRINKFINFFLDLLTLHLPLESIRYIKRCN